MNKITSMFLHRNGEKGGLLSLYFCVGSTSADDTSRIILTLQRRGIHSYRRRTPPEHTPRHTPLSSRRRVPDSAFVPLRAEV
ncbi:hypothetical protein [Prevotella sp.]|uniref:hypothetical protein n=1 Tax=Prevotella sp. TaxID=59823 RepID=UPI003080A2D7